MKVRSTLRRVSRWLALAAALGVLVLSLRVAWLTAREWGAYRDQQDGATPRRVSKTSSADPNAAEPLASAAAASSAPADPTPTPRTLWVRWGPARSEVYVNGVHLGETPYAGDWSCVDGDLFEVRVIPPQGPPLVRRVRCAGTLLLIGDGKP